MIRVVYVKTAMTSVNVGSTSSFGCDHGLSSGGMIETAGSTVKTVVPSRTTSAIPITNSGRAARASMTTPEAWSNGRSRRAAL